MILIKLGGSVITDKSKPYFFKKNTVDRLAYEIKTAGQQVMLVHGAGSFGHILAKEYHLEDGFQDKKQLYGMVATLEKVQKLNTMILEVFLTHSLPVVSLPPHAFLELSDQKPGDVNLYFFQRYLKYGFIPVTFGDVVLDTKRGCTICSGDLLMYLLADYFKPEKVVFVFDEDGLFTANPKLEKNAQFIEETSVHNLKSFSTGADTHADVTKGMQGKLDIIAAIGKLGIDTVLVNGNKDKRLHDILVNKKTVCTYIRGEK
ncbi:MAG: isopentenyl phosphate kinase [Candidatus Thermoplasmatota archaeon]